MSSSIASMTESIVLCPPEAQRIREIFGIKVLNKWDPRVLYKGYIPTLVRSGTSSITTFWGADFLLDCFDPGRESRFSSFLFGTVAGIAAQLITAPIEIIKTRIMSDYKHSRSMRWHVRDLRHSGGFGKSIISRGMLTGFRCGFIIGGMNAMKRFLEDIEPY
ncbi:MAG: MC/SLC25 family protein [bacterium]|nr:MC/SLC25 family protein [bacterium]